MCPTSIELQKTKCLKRAIPLASDSDRRKGADTSLGAFKIYLCDCSSTSCLPKCLDDTAEYFNVERTSGSFEKKVVRFNR